MRLGLPGLSLVDSPKRKISQSHVSTSPIPQQHIRVRKKRRQIIIRVVITVSKLF